MSAAQQTGGPANIGYDVATALWQGKRPYQEDTLLADFHGGMDRGFAVLADGMGGHAAGDLASRLVVIDAVSHLKFLIHDGDALEKNLQAELKSAVDTANDVLRDRAADDSRLAGMGATFLATVLFEDRLYWASVGDSPLYLWREGRLRQLNEDHSMAPIIDQMAKSGEISTEEAANHPDRNALTSVLMGRSVKAMDVPKTATVLDPGDVLIQASDGLQYLDEAAIAVVLEAAGPGASSREISDRLMGALRKLNDPAQDNTAILVLQLTEGPGGGGAVLPAGAGAAAAGERAMLAGAAGNGDGGATALAAATSEARVAAADAHAAKPLTAPALTPSGARAPTPSDVERPSGGRRWIVPAALLGGAAVVFGLFFGLPSDDDTTDLASATPPLQTPGPDVSIAPPDPVASAGALAPTNSSIVAADGPDSAEPLASEALDGGAITDADGAAEEGPAPEAADPELADAPELTGEEEVLDTALAEAEVSQGDPENGSSEAAPLDEAPLGAAPEATSEPDPEAGPTAPEQAEAPDAETPDQASAAAELPAPEPEAENEIATEGVGEAEASHGDPEVVDPTPAQANPVPADAPEEEAAAAAADEPVEPPLETGSEIVGGVAPDKLSNPVPVDLDVDVEPEVGLESEPEGGGDMEATPDAAGGADADDGAAVVPEGNGLEAGTDTAIMPDATTVGIGALGVGGRTAAQGGDGAPARAAPVPAPTPMPAPAIVPPPRPTQSPALTTQTVPRQAPGSAPVASPAPVPVPVPTPIPGPAPTLAPRVVLQTGVTPSGSLLPGVGQLQEGLSAPPAVAPTPLPMPVPLPILPRRPLLLDPSQEESGVRNPTPRTLSQQATLSAPIQPSEATPFLPPFRGRILQGCDLLRCVTIVVRP